MTDDFQQNKIEQVREAAKKWIEAFKKSTPDVGITRLDSNEYPALITDNPRQMFDDQEQERAAEEIFLDFSLIES